jgi:thiol-disulfide isomerase/thioredoxin/uncharacterized membrane protein YphA (DoxX/SURF4 family)
MEQVVAVGTERGVGPARFGLLDRLDLVARAAAGAVFLYAGIAKSLNFEATLLAVHGYRIVPAFLERPIAYGLPWLEIALGALLLLGLSTRFAGLGAALLAAVFLVAMSQALLRGLAIGCGCFGSATGQLSWLDPIRDMPLLAAGLYLAIRRNGSWRLDRSLGSGHAKPTGDDQDPSGRPRGPQGGGREWLRIAIPTAIIVAVVAAAVGVFALTAGGASANHGVSVSGPARSSPIPAGTTLPQFTAPALGGGQISWASYRGGPTVLIIWAPWCAECERELPIVTAVAKQFPAVRLTSIVTAVGQEPGPTPAQYMRKHGYTFPVALDSQDQNLADAFGLTGYPLIYYVYSDGVVGRATIGVAPARVVRELMVQIAG